MPRTSSPPRTAVRPRVSRVVRWLATHPAWAVALRSGIAAGLAWWVAWVVGLAFPDPFADYRYYAPLGAVVATSSTAARSVSQSVRATVAIVLGAAVAGVLDLVLPVDSLTVAVVVVAASLLAGWRTLGDMGTWTVNSALFVLVIGGARDQSDFVIAYIGLVVVGAGVGVLVNLAAPPLPLAPSEKALDDLRDVLADQLDALADGLHGDRAPRAEEWEERRRAVAPAVDGSRQAAERAREAQRLNLRARRHRGRLHEQELRSERLAVTTAVVTDLVRVLTEGERDDLDLDRQVLGATLRHPVAEALAALAVVVRDGPDADREPAREAVLALRRALAHERDRGSGDDYLAAGAVVLDIERALEANRATTDGADDG
ncbi:aromatic acid exporter family protein [Cellulosimicrobium marinum]|uniref:aromatic acid exporter family protein n=1 Tax=Cellulosimicrobium marinum TaxID=1638992 RepID=UPI001E46BB2A|nr:aromatic acid exporter family protein [Cellulosimicrobium marinum]MCB7136565.1 aromatic acid exporter family protein [Cellulosimicrobium marinum]